MSAALFGGAVALVIVCLWAAVGLTPWSRTNARMRLLEPHPAPARLAGVPVPESVFDVTSAAEADLYVAYMLEHTAMDAATLRRATNDLLWSHNCGPELAFGCARVLNALDRWAAR